VRRGRRRLRHLAIAAPADRAAVVDDARVFPALAAAICSHHADGTVVEAAGLVSRCIPGEARAERQLSLVRLGALDAAVRRLSAGGRVGAAAAFLVGALADGRPDDVAAAAVAAGALPRLVALLRDADESADEAARALSRVVGLAGSPAAAAAVDAGGVGAVAALLGRSDASADSALLLLSALARTPAGAARLVADGALPHVVRLLRSPAPGVANRAVLCLFAATFPRTWDAVAEALLADAAAAPALVELLLGPGGEAPIQAACVLGMTLDWAITCGGPDEFRRAGGLAAAARRAGAVPRLVGLLRASLEGQRQRSAVDILGAIAVVCHVDAAAAREALDAGAWPAASRALLEQDARAGRADEQLVAHSLHLLSELAPHLRDGAPRPAAAAAEPGLAAAAARVFGRAAARVPRGTRAHTVHYPGMAGNAAEVLEEALEGSDGAERAAEFVQAGGAGHLVRPRQGWGHTSGSFGRVAWAL
jgi:hypothetical protein